MLNVVRAKRPYLFIANLTIFIDEEALGYPVNAIINADIAI